MKKFLTLVLFVLATSTTATTATTASAQQPAKPGEDPMAKFFYLPELVMAHQGEIGLTDRQRGAARSRTSSRTRRASFSMRSSR